MSLNTHAGARNFARAAGHLRQTEPEGAGAGLEALFKGFIDTSDFSSELASVKAPTLVLCGDRDAYANSAQQDRLRTVLPRARHVTYEGTGHALHWEAPARFVADLMDFVYERPQTVLR